MTRSTAREIAVRIGFGLTEDENPWETLDSFFDREYYSTLGEEDAIFEKYPDKRQLDYISAVVAGTVERREELDSLIEKYASGWKVSRITKTALQILRTAIFETLYVEDVPESVAIDEAVELAKKYDEPETVSFINGVLGGFARGEKAEAGKAEQE